MEFPIHLDGYFLTDGGGVILNGQFISGLAPQLISQNKAGTAN